MYITLFKLHTFYDNFSRPTFPCHIFNEIDKCQENSSD